MEPVHAESSLSVGIARTEDAVGTDARPGGHLALANRLQPPVDRGAGRKAYQFGAQELLHRLMPPRGARGKAVANCFGNAAYGDPHRHDSTIPSTAARRSLERRARYSSRTPWLRTRKYTATRTRSPALAATTVSVGA